jgi:hypothetical protein
LIVALPKAIQPKKPVAFEQGGKKGHLYELGNARVAGLVICEFPSGDLKQYLVIRPHKDATLREDLALFVTDDGSTRVRIRKAGATEWVAGTELIGVHKVIDILNPAIEEVDACGPDEIEKVNPNCYW